MQTNLPSWRTAIRGRDGKIFAAERPGVPHLCLMQTIKPEDFGPCAELGFVDADGHFHSRADALAVCGAAHGFTMTYPEPLRRLIAWAERRPVRYFYLTAGGSLTAVAALIALCEVFL